MVKISQEQLDRLNLISLFNAHPIGSEIETAKGVAIVNGYKLSKEEMVFTARLSNEGAKARIYTLNPAKYGIKLLTDPDNIAEVLKTTEAVIGQLNSGLPKGVETKVEAVPAFGFSGAKLKAMRIAMNLTQVFVAEYLGMAKSSSAAIGDWEAERNKVPVKHQAKLIDLYTPDPEEEIEELEDLEELESEVAEEAQGDEQERQEEDQGDTAAEQMEANGDESGDESQNEEVKE